MGKPFYHNPIPCIVSFTSISYYFSPSHPTTTPNPNEQVFPPPPPPPPTHTHTRAKYMYMYNATPMGTSLSVCCMYCTTHRSCCNMTTNCFPRFKHELPYFQNTSILNTIHVSQLTSCFTFNSTTPQPPRYT